MADLKSVYRKISGDWVKQTAYERQGGAWVLISTAEQEPVSYLYGRVAQDGETPTHIIDGVEYVGEVLPALPVVEGYPYAVIEYADVSALVEGGLMARLIFSSEPIVYTSGVFVLGYNLLGDVVCYGWANHEAVWEHSLVMDAPSSPYNKWVKKSEEHFDETTFEAEQVGAASPIWANFDLRRVSGTINSVIVYASNPVPVYE